jgi:uncharacterized protein YuzE
MRDSSTVAEKRGSRPSAAPQVTVRYDAAADAAWVFLRDGPFAETQELDPWRLIDVDAEGNPLRIELLTVSRGVDTTDLPQAKQVARALQHAGITVRMPER